MADIDKSMLPVRQLWIAGMRASRRTLAGAALNLSWPHGGFAFNGEAPAWLATAAADQVEVRWPKVVKNWLEPRCIVTSVNLSMRALLLDPECYAKLEARMPHHQRPRPGGAFFENVAGPPAPGEFYATTSAVYFRPNGTAAPEDAWVPTQEVLINASGLHGHSFQGLRFAYSTMRLPSAPGGYVETQAAPPPKLPPLARTAPCGS